jgi:DNA primase
MAGVASMLCYEHAIAPWLWRRRTRRRWASCNPYPDEPFILDVDPTTVTRFKQVVAAACDHHALPLASSHQACDLVVVFDSAGDRQ